jgi:hypothetical protein
VKRLIFSPLFGVIVLLLACAFTPFVWYEFRVGGCLYREDIEAVLTPGISMAAAHSALDNWQFDILSWDSVPMLPVDPPGTVGTAIRVRHTLLGDQTIILQLHFTEKKLTRVDIIGADFGFWI